MPAWKVMFIGLLAATCMGLATATFVVPFSQDGNERWLWMAGLFVGTLAMGGLFALFLKRATIALDAKQRR